jgi:hypothetical protein
MTRRYKGRERSNVKVCSAIAWREAFYMKHAGKDGGEANHFPDLTGSIQAV